MFEETYRFDFHSWRKPFKGKATLEVGTILGFAHKEATST